MTSALHQAVALAAAAAVCAGLYCRGADTAAGEAAIKQAADAKKHLFLLFCSQYDEATRAARKSAEGVLAGMSDAAQLAVLAKDDPAEKALVEKLQLPNTPAPWLVVLAPNGAVTRSCQGAELSEEEAKAAIAGPAQQAYLKALQDRKLVVLCAYSQNAGADDPAVKAVDEFKRGPYGRLTEVVRVDPAGGEEARWLKRLGIDAERERTTVMVFPPETTIGRFAGPVTKADMEAAVRRMLDADDG